MQSSRSSALETKVILFWTPEQQDRKEDWESCFPLKAAAVYSSITKKLADARAMSIASDLLISIAENCVYSANNQQPRLAAPPASDTTMPSSVVKEKLVDVRRSLPEPTMEAIDAVYVVVAILHDLKDKSKLFPDREKLDAHYASSRRQDEISDVVKIRNQLPLDLLKNTVKKFQAAWKKAVEALRPLANTYKDLNISSIKGFKLSFDEGSFNDAIHIFCWYYSPFYSKLAPATSGGEEGVSSAKENLLECLHSSLVDAPSPAAGAGVVDVGRPVTPPLPRATQLAQSGLGFAAASDGKIKAQFSMPTLHIPAVVFDHKLETVVVNLLEWERSRGVERPVARYLMLLRDLVDDEGDVKVLWKAGVLRGRWRKEGEVVDFLRKAEGFASCPLAYPAVDDVVERVRNAHGEEKVGRLTEIVRNHPAAVWASAALLVSFVVAAVAAKRRTG